MSGSEPGVIKLSYKPRALCGGHKVFRDMPHVVARARERQALTCPFCHAKALEMVSRRARYIARVRDGAPAVPLFNERGEIVGLDEILPALRLSLGDRVAFWDGKVSLPRDADADLSPTLERLWGSRVLTALAALAALTPQVSVAGVHRDTDNPHLHLILSGLAWPLPGHATRARRDLTFPREAFPLIQRRMRALAREVGGAPGAGAGQGARWAVVGAVGAAGARPAPGRPHNPGGPAGAPGGAWGALGALGALARRAAHALARALHLTAGQEATWHPALLAVVVATAALALVIVLLVLLFVVAALLRGRAPAQPVLVRAETVEPGSARWAGRDELRAYAIAIGGRAEEEEEEVYDDHT